MINPSVFIIENLSLNDSMMVDERRLNLTEAFNWAFLNIQQFEPVLDTLMSMWNNISYKTVKMAAVTRSEEHTSELSHSIASRMPSSA